MTARALPPRLGRLRRAMNAGRPPLDGALCAGRWELFDPAPDRVDGLDVETPHETADRHEQAAALCQACPVLPSCSEWHTSTPLRLRAAGVVAGIRPDLPRPTGRPPKEAVA